MPEEFVGAVTTLLATRKGTMVDMVNHGTGWVRLEWRIPARGLVGIRTEFMTETRGGGIMHSNFDGYAPWFGDIRLRQNGVLVADRRGDTTGNALLDLEPVSYTHLHYPRGQRVAWRHHVERASRSADLPIQ